MRDGLAGVVCACKGRANTGGFSGLVPGCTAAPPPPARRREMADCTATPLETKKPKTIKCLTCATPTNIIIFKMAIEDDVELLKYHLETKHEKQTGEDGCWLWTGPVKDDHSGPRGDIKIGTGAAHPRRYKAHRAAYRVWVGPIPAGKNICHTCDVSLCIRPDHLFAGSQGDNVRDCVAKGRHRNGSHPGMNVFKLSDEEVNEIRKRRKSGESGVKLAKEFGVHHAQVYRICGEKSRKVAV